MTHGFSTTRRRAWLAGLSMLAGLFASYHLDLPSGVTIVLAQATLFFVALTMTAARRTGRRIAARPRSSPRV